jgi:hypothetical protein
MKERKPRWRNKAKEFRAGDKNYMAIVSVSSDLHLGFEYCKLPGGDILLLPGDIFDEANRLQKRKNDADSRALRKRYHKFCAQELRKYALVLYTPGNHEGYYGVIPDDYALIKDMFSDLAPNTHLLDNATMDIDGVRFIGSTLWATYGYGTANELLIREGMNDFALIDVPREENKFGFETRKFAVADANRLHHEAVTYIGKALDTELPCVAFTHHAPSYLSCNRKRFPDGRMDDAYASNLQDLILDHPNCKVWTHGHSHYRYRAKVGDTKITANPRGYYGHERSSMHFNSAEADFDLKTFEFVD